MKEFFTVLCIVIIAPLTFGQTPKKTERVNLNGIELYYEVYGEGEPLLLLHGWTQSSQFWSAYVPAYLKHYEVYAIDLRGHGKTSELTSDFTIKKSSLDILTLMDHLKIEKAKAIGLSYGGLVLLQLASLYPDRIVSMILIGASHNYNGAENTQLENTPSYEDFPASFIEQLKATHHRGESQLKALFDQNLNYEISLSDKEMNLIESRSLIINGDRDEIQGVDPAITLYKKLLNAELWIVPNTGHIAISGPNQEEFLKRSVEFLNKD